VPAILDAWRVGSSGFVLADAGGIGATVTVWVALAVLAVVVAAETALRNFRWSRLEGLVGSKERLQRIQDALKDEHTILDGLIALRLFSTFAVLLGVLGVFSPNTGLGPAVDPKGFLKDLALVLVIFLGGLHGIVRGIARVVPERTLLACLHPARLLGRTLTPIVWVTDAIGQAACGALGLKKVGEEEEARHEILDAVTEGEREGAIDDEGREMIENIIESQDQAVSQVMTPRTSVFAIPVETPLDDAVRMVVDQGHSRVPVFQGTIDNVQGVLYAKDLLAYWTRRGSSPPGLRDVMRKPVFVPETKKASDLLNELRRDQVHLAIVLDEYGGMSGIVTVEDLLEEIVGEIRDEYDQKDGKDEPRLVRCEDGSAEADGVARIDVLNEALDLQIPEDESYDTVGGFVSTRLGRVPERGEVCLIDGMRFEILDADARRIRRVRVTAGQGSAVE